MVFHLRLDRIVKNNPGYIKAVIPSSAYKTNPFDIPTLGIVTSAIVHKDLPDDLVYKMAKVFWKIMQSLQKLKVFGIKLF